MKKTVAVFLFGKVKIVHNNKSLKFHTDKMRALFAYLVFAPNRPHQREALSALLWEEFTEVVALKNLRQTLNLLRKLSAELEQHDLPPLFETTRHTIQLNLDPKIHWIDVLQFDALIESCENHPHRQNARCSICVERQKRAAALYNDDFLADLVINSNSFSQWQKFQRQTRRRQLIFSLSRLTENALLTSRFDEVFELTDKQLSFEPTLENAVQQKMTALTWAHNEKLAIKTYHAHVDRLASQSQAMLPSAETKELYTQILNDSAEFRRSSRPILYNHIVEPTTIEPANDDIEKLVDLLIDPVYRLITFVTPDIRERVPLVEAAGARIRLPVCSEGIYCFTNENILPVTDSLLVDGIAQMLNVQPIDGQTMNETVFSTFQDQDRLAIFIGFPTEPKTADFIYRVLSTSNLVNIIFLSDAPLNLREEYVFRLAADLAKT